MRPRTSEIFESYVKLSEEKESKELKTYRSETYPRVGSDDISTIEALYGTKPEPSPGMDYDLNIAQLAHPNAVIVSPSYDKLNGLVENINERHNIIVNKVMSKAPSGSVFLLKDASQELTMELIRIGNDMDNADEEELRLLADDCLENLNKQAGRWWDDAKEFVEKTFGDRAEKTVSDVESVGKGALEGAASGAVAGLIIGLWGGPVGAGVGAAIGGLAGGIGGYLLNTGSKIRNIKENSKDLLEQLNDLKKSVPEEISFFTTIENTIAKLVKSSDAYLSAINMVRIKELKNEAASSGELEEVKKDTAEFISLIDEFKKVKNMFIKKSNEGAFAKALNRTPFVDDDIDDVMKEFQSLSVAIDNLKSTMSGITEKAKVEVSKIPTKSVSTDQPIIHPLSYDSPDLTDSLKGLAHPPTKEDLNFIGGLK